MEGKYCKADGCNKEAVVKGYCHKHYKHIIRYGRIAPEHEHRSAGICKIGECSSMAVSRGYCQKHYMRVYMAERANSICRKSDTCKVDGCNNRIKARGYCNKHYTKLYRNGAFKIK